MNAPAIGPNDLILGAALGVWVLFVLLVLTRLAYDAMVKRGVEPIRAVYYNRKIIHSLAGGLVGLLLPLFSSWPIPVAAALALALFTYIPHKMGRLLYWFQTQDNLYEVSFAIMWALVVFLSWAVLNDLVLGLLPILFMAFGDSATGVVRNALFKRRTKHWLGNVAMAAISIPLGYYFMGLGGALAGLIASAVERFEYPPIDDNVLVPLTSFIFLLAWQAIYSPSHIAL
jgi:dolichol kinase